MSKFLAVRRDSLLRYLQRQIAGEVRFDDTTRRLYSTDASLYQVQPLGVVLPKTLDDLLATVQIAGELRIPITARGGGTSLSGQAIGPGIVIDCSKYFHQILAIDPEARTVRVQPGVVLEHLNRALAPHGLMFGPDVAPANRATLGGMIGNNSAGARSVVYGRTVDHVRTLRMILADGKLRDVGPLSPLQLEKKQELDDCEGEGYRTVCRVLKAHATEIETRFPKILRAVSGYNLLGVRHSHADTFSLVPLFVGSEGTLGVVAEAELKLVPKPRTRGLLVPHFASLRSALDAVAVCLEFQPSAVELLDKMLIHLAREQPALKQQMAAVIGKPDALLMVEFSGDSEAEIAGRVEKLAKRLAGVAGLTAAVRAIDPNLRDPLWNLRSSSMPLLYGIPGNRKPVTFVEDCAVAPERMPEFASRFRELLQRHGTDGAFYGHASVGCLHIRPLLDLHDHRDVRTMRAIMEEVTDLVLAFNGSLSGEHGDGLVRSEWNQKMFGPQIYQAFREIKRAFDPESLMNPGKIVDAPAMESQLRVDPSTPIAAADTIFDYSRQGGFFRSIELCNGAGVCRKTQGGTMCPSYRATRDEQDSTRGRANALRQALTGDLAIGKTVGTSKKTNLPVPSTSPLSQRWLQPVMDLCLSCKACKTECPSNVDMAKLKAEFQQAYYADRVRPRGDYLVKNIDVLSPIGARWAGTVNWFGRRRFIRGLLEAVTGIDRRRSLPEFHREHFRRWFRQRAAERETGQATGQRSVILLDDCFTTFQEPNIGQSAVKILEQAGYQVELAGICCGRAMISKGFLLEAQELARKAIPRLAQRAREGVPILGLEPSCIYTLADEWTDLVPGVQARQVAAMAEPIETWLARHAAAGEIILPFLAPTHAPALLHTHCHQRALAGPAGPAASLRLIQNLDLTVLDAGCCGMAGAFGYEKTHYDMSVAIANLALIPAIQAAPETTIIATGTSCRHQIRDLTGRMAYHPVELLAKSLIRTDKCLPAHNAVSTSVT